MKRFLLVSLALVGMVATAPSAHAALLNPGQGSLTADAFGAETGTLVTTDSGALNNTSTPGGTINASFQEWVYKETATGFLTFIYQVTVNSGDALEQVAVSNFTNFGSAASSTAVDVGVTSSLSGPPTPASGGVAPNAGVLGNVVNRSGSGATVNFQFTGSAEILAGQHSVLLTVQTNATTTATGTISVQDSSSTFTADLGPGGTPINAVPEPSSLAIASIGALGMIGFVLRRRKALCA